MSNFIALYNARTKHINNLTPDKIVSTVVDLIKPITYVPYDKKLDLIDKTICDSMDDKFPTASRYKHFVMNMIALYTNLEVKDGDFDILSETKMLDIVLSTFESEYRVCSNLMQFCLQDLKGG